MKAGFRSMVALALSISVSGCYNTHVKSVIATANGGTSPVNEGPHYEDQSKTVVALFWGLGQPDDLDESRCNGNGLAHVRTTDSFGYSLINVATLGIVMLHRVEWWCATDRQTEPNPRD